MTIPSLRRRVASSMVVLVGLLTFPGSAYAQTGSIEGQVTDPETGAALPGVNVILQGTDRGTATQSDGTFSLRGVATGSYTLRASNVGYETVTREVQVREGETPSLNIELSQEAVELSNITVLDRRGGYNTDRTVSAMRVAAPNLETAVSVQAVPQQVIEDQEATTLREVTRNVSGVQRASTFGGALQRFRIRGFSQQIMLQNGFRTGGANTKVFAETAHLERVEVLKGPASILYGRLEPGGIINLVTEKPTAEPRYSARLRGGSYGFIEPSVDLSGPVNESGSLTYRLNGLYRREDGFREPFDQAFERLFVAPVLSWQINGQTTLTLEGTYLDNTRPFDRGIFTDDIVDVPHTRNLQEPGDVAETERVSAGYTLEHRFGDHLKLRNRFRYYRNEFFNVENNPFAFTDSTETVSRFLGSNDAVNETFTLQTSLIGNFRTGALDHSVLAGIDLDRDQEDRTFQSTNSSFDITTINAFDPVYDKGTPSRDELTFASLDKEDEFDALGLYVQDRISIAGQWHLLLGGRFDVVDQVRTQFDPDTTTSTSTLQNDHAFSPRGGLVYQPTTFLSLYGSVSRSFVPNGGMRVDGSTIDPEQGTQYEAGVKSEWLGGRLSATIAGFVLQKTNIEMTDPDNTNFSVATGEAESRGVELDVSGQVVRGWRLIGSYAYTDTEIVEDDNEELEGNAFPEAPEHSGSFWSTYELQDGPLRGLKVGGGAFFVGEREGDRANSFQLDSYTRIDATLSYGRDNWRVGFNLKNITDTDHVVATSGAFSKIHPGIPFTAVGTALVTF